MTGAAVYFRKKEQPTELHKMEMSEEALETGKETSRNA